MKDAPIDVIVTCHNEAEYIGPAVESIYAQTASYLINKVIIVDDGSTDASVSIIDHLARSHPNLEAHHIDNRGLSGARNFALSRSLAPFVAILDGDDLWSRRKIELQWPYVASAKPNCAIWYSDYIEFNSTPADGTTSYVRQFHETDENFLERYFVFDAPIIPSTVILRRAALVAVGLFNEEVKLFEDMELWLRLALKHRAQYTPGSLLFKRRRHGSLSTNFDRWEAATSAIADIALASSPKLESLLRKRDAYRLAKLGYGYAYSGRDVEARRALTRSLAINPLSPRALCYMVMLLVPRASRQGAFAHLKTALRQPVGLGEMSSRNSLDHE